MKHSTIARISPFNRVGSGRSTPTSDEKVTGLESLKFHSVNGEEAL